MNHLFLWLRQNALIPLAMITLTAIIAIGVQMREIDATQYRTIRGAFKIGSPRYQIEVSKAMTGGTITRWEYIHLIRAALDEEKLIAISNEYASLAEERLLLAAMAKQVRSQ